MRFSFTNYDAQTLTAFLTAMPDSTGTPNVAGYPMTEDPVGLYTSDVVGEALVGEFYVIALDGAGALAFTGYVTVIADSTTYRCYEFTQSGESGSTIILQQIKAKTDLISSGGFSVVERNAGDPIRVYTDETYNLVLTVSEDHTLKTLVIVWEDDKHVELARAAVAVTDTTLAFDLPIAVTGVGACGLSYAIRATSEGDRVLYSNDFIVDWAPN